MLNMTSKTRTKPPRLSQNVKLLPDVFIFGLGILKHIVKKLSLFLSYERKTFEGQIIRIK